MLVSYSLMLLLGILVGALGVRFGSLNGRRHKKERLLLQQRQQQLDHCYRELASHVARNITVLETLISEYRLLQQALPSTSARLPDHLLYRHNLGGRSTTQQEQSLIKAEPPCDYSSSASDLLSPKQPLTSG